MKKLFFTIMAMMPAVIMLAQKQAQPKTQSQTQTQPQTQAAEPKIVAVPATQRVSAAIIKIDTFTYTIGRTDFRLATTANAGEYIKMLPHGITVKKMGVNEGKSANSLIAPVNLPAGAVIRRVIFHYIILPGSSAVPHLVLRSHYLTANGGFGINKAITSYWLTSNSLNTANGYDVKASVTSPGFNVSISKSSTHYFEILAADARPVTTPQQSIWPDNDKIFIWSIDVQYTL
jgi:hypothetical protein